MPRTRSLKSLQRNFEKMAALCKTMAKDVAALDGERLPKVSTARRRRPNARRLNTMTVAEACERVLARRTKPMHHKDLTETIRKRGLYRSRSENLLSTVEITLGRDRRFKRVEPGMYTLR